MSVQRQSEIYNKVRDVYIISLDKTQKAVIPEIEDCFCRNVSVYLEDHHFFVGRVIRDAISFYERELSRSCN